jgi:tetratricopeptide (TPR) repeat protein
MWKHSATLDDRAWSQAAQALEEAGRYTDSVEWRRRAAEAGSGHEWFAYAKSLTHDGQYDEGIDWYQRAVEAGQDASPAEGWQAELLRESGTGQGDLSQWRTTFLESHHFLGKWKRGRLTHQTVDEVLAWLVDLTDRGHPSSLGYAVSLLCDEGRQNEALQWALVLAERGHEGASRQVAQLLADAGDVDESLRWWERVASDSEHGYSALRSGAQILEEAGRQEDAVQWFRRAVEAGDIDILWHTVELYESLGESQEALAWLWQLAVCGWSFALQLTCDVLRRAGRHAEAQQLRRYGWEADGSIANAWNAPVPATAAAV